jgi:Ca2+-binding EF-hand superfamily protein
MKAKFFLSTVFSLIAIASYSQDASVSEEELTKYATVMDSISEMTINFQSSISTMVKESEAITGTRYNELSKIISDEAKLTEAKATPEEIAFIKGMAEKKKEETSKINQAFQTLVKENLGAATYNKVKKALATDTTLKQKYDSLIEEMEKDNKVEKETESK